jgi:hypothetical protein
VFHLSGHHRLRDAAGLQGLDALAQLAEIDPRQRGTADFLRQAVDFRGGSPLIATTTTS